MSQPSASPDHHGVRAPRVRNLPAASRARSLGGQAADFAAACGLELDGWQRDVLVEACRVRPDGRWASFEVGLVVPRQNGKGAVLEALELAALFLWDEQLILHSAHQFKTAREAFLRMAARIAVMPDLKQRVLREWRSHGDEGFELRTGARLRYVARSGGSGRGFTADRIVLDEAYELDAGAMGAILPTLSAVPNPQVWYTSSAPMLTSSQLHMIRERGLTGTDESLCYLEWSAPDDVMSDDRAAWARANPAMGIRIDPESVARERAAMPEAEFRRERLGIAELPSAANIDRPISVEDWARAEDASSRPGLVVKFGLAVHPSRQWSALTAASVRADGRVHVEVIGAAAGVAWLLPRAIQVATDWKAPMCVEAGGPSGALLPDLQAAGVEVVALARRDVVAAFGRVSDLAVNDKLRHTGQAQLTAAVHMAERRVSGEQLVWVQHGADITPLYAAALAVWQVALPDEAKSTLSF